jgi:hypothetical protein
MKPKTFYCFMLHTGDDNLTAIRFSSSSSIPSLPDHIPGNFIVSFRTSDLVSLIWKFDHWFPVSLLSSINPGVQNV